MALVWTPDNTQPLYTGSETLTSPLILSVSVLDDDPAATEQPVITNITLPPNMNQITVSGIGTDSINITIPHFSGLYPIEIKLVNFETQETITQTNFNVPTGHKIFSYTKDTNTPRTMSIIVESGLESMTYELIVSADYSSNLSDFLQAVQDSN